jgi:hypothetical protein
MQSDFEWAVIGAGPAGIAAVGKLLDKKISPAHIAWIDPNFQGGDFGTHWRKVSSNTRVKYFLKFFNACDAFAYTSAYNDFAIHRLPPEETCDISLVAEVLQSITEGLKQKVTNIQGTVQQLHASDRHWHLSLAGKVIQAKNVILAIGAIPKTLEYPGVATISLHTALDPDKLTRVLNAEDVVAVFGSSHSAILSLKTLLSHCQIKKVINFYLSPLRYAVALDDWILFDNTGLKGRAAEWARANIDGKLPPKLQRVHATAKNICDYLPQCNKAIYAIGFQKRTIRIPELLTLEHNNCNGIIAPGLFGVGIAFPQVKADPYGFHEARVGLWKFMEDLNQVMPLWLHYSI